MKLLFAFFADSVVLTGDGRFHVLNGSTSGLRAQAFPATVPNLNLLARFSFDKSEFGKDLVSRVKVVAPTGAELNPPLEVRLAPSAYHQHPERPNVYTVLYRYDGFTMTVPGEYRFHIHVDDQVVGDLSLDAVLETP